MVGRGSGKNGYLSFEDFCLISEFNEVEEYNIDICANSEDQAKMSFDDVYKVLEKNKQKLKTHFYWSKELIRNLKTGSELRFRTSNAKTKDGGRPGKIDFDEYHMYENYKTINVFTTGLGKKANPRTTVITTQGDVRDGPLDALLITALNILKGAEEDNGTLPFITRLDDEKEVDNPLMWDKANPSLHLLTYLKIEMKKEYVKYKKDPINNSSFMVKRMNLPKGDVDVEVTSWDNVLATNQSIPEELLGATCIGAIDYARTTDFVCAGLLFLFKGKYCWLSHTWICSRCNDLERIKVPLHEWEEQDGWEGQKLLTFVDAVEVAPSIPAEWLAEMGKKYNITTLCMDNYRYTLLTRALREAGFDTDKDGINNIKLIRPSNIMLISPVINSLFANHNIVFGDNPLMRWYTNNTCIHPEPHDNISFGKIEPKSRKTDGFMAFVGAMCASENLVDSGEVVMTDLNLDCFTY